MMSPSIHKFVVVCRFEKFDMAAGARGGGTGMKELGGQAAKKRRRRGEVALVEGKEQTSSA